jgi:hypothetical protein
MWKSHRTPWQNAPSAYASGATEVVGRGTDIVVGPATNGQRVVTAFTVVPTFEEATAVEVEVCVAACEG